MPYYKLIKNERGLKIGLNDFRARFCTLNSLIYKLNRHNKVCVLTVSNDKEENRENREHTDGPFVIEQILDLGVVDTWKDLVARGLDLRARQDYVLTWAAKKGHLEVVKYLVEKIGTNEQALRLAAKKHHFTVAKYLLSQGIGCPYDIREEIIHYGSPDIVNALIKKIDLTLSQVFSEACCYGNIKVMEDLVGQGLSIKKQTWCLDSACYNGLLDVVKFFVAHGVNLKTHFQDGPKILREVLYHGHLEMAKYLIEQEVQFVPRNRLESELERLAVRNHLHIIAYLINMHKSQLDIQSIIGSFNLWNALKTLICLNNQMRLYCLYVLERCRSGLLERKLVDKILDYHPLKLKRLGVNDLEQSTGEVLISRILTEIKSRKRRK